MSMIANERIKLTAGLLNTVSGFALTAGAVAPLIALSYGLTAAPIIEPLVLILIVAIWFGVGLAFHVAARRLLGRLKT